MLQFLSYSISHQGNEKSNFFIIITETCCVKMVPKNQPVGTGFLSQISLEIQQFCYDATGLQLSKKKIPFHCRCLATCTHGTHVRT